MSSETIDVESLLNFNRDLNLQQPKKDILYYVQIVPSHTSFSLILYLLYYVENQHKISRNLNNKTRKYSSLEIHVCVNFTSVVLIRLASWVLVKDLFIHKAAVIWKQLIFQNER